MSTTVKGGIEGLTGFQYTVGDVQSFRIIAPMMSMGGLPAWAKRDRKVRPQVALVTSEAQGRDFLEEPPCIRRIEVLFGIRGAHGRDQRPGLFARTIGIGGVWRAVWGRSKNPKQFLL